MVAVFKDIPVMRRMREADLTQVIEIESTSYSFPWTQGIFNDCMIVGYHCEVLEVDSILCGYTVFSVAVGEAHILNLCIAPDYRGQGLSRVLLEMILAQAKTHGANYLYLEVRPSNQTAINLYTSVGFTEIARRKHYYPAAEGREDAIMLARSID